MRYFYKQRDYANFLDRLGMLTKLQIQFAIKLFSKQLHKAFPSEGTYV